MLVFGMNDADYVVINDNIVVRINRDGNNVKLYIEAPPDVTIEHNRRQEEGPTSNRQFTERSSEKYLNLRATRIIKKRPLNQVAASLPPPVATRNESQQTINKVSVWKENNIILLDPAAILYLSMDDKKVTVHALDDRYKSTKSLAELTEKLESQGFFRCHKSFVVNINFIDKIVPWFHSTYLIRLKGSTEQIPVSRHYTKELKKLLNL